MTLTDSESQVPRWLSSGLVPGWDGADGGRNGQRRTESAAPQRTSFLPSSLPGGWLHTNLCTFQNIITDTPNSRTVTVKENRQTARRQPPTWLCLTRPARPDWQASPHASTVFHQFGPPVSSRVPACKYGAHVPVVGTSLKPTSLHPHQLSLSHSFSSNSHSLLLGYSSIHLGQGPTIWAYSGWPHFQRPGQPPATLALTLTLTYSQVWV